MRIGQGAQRRKRQEKEETSKVSKVKGRQGSRAKILAEQMAKCDKGEAETKEDKAEVKDACEGWRVHVGRMHIGGRSWGKKEKETRNGTEQEGEQG